MSILNGIENSAGQEKLSEPIEIQMLSREDIQGRREVFSFDICDLRATAEEVDFNPETDYVISRINGKNKFTEGLANCTSLVAIGSGREANENISFQTHQSDPLEDSSFYSELSEILDVIKARSVDGTIRVVLAGGSAAHPVRQRAYQQTVSLITTLVRERLGIDLDVVVEPKLDTKNDETVYVDTQNRIVYVIR